MPLKCNSKARMNRIKLDPMNCECDTRDELNGLLGLDVVTEVLS